MKDATLTETSLRAMFAAARESGYDVLHPVGVALGLTAHGLEVTRIYRSMFGEFVVCLSDGRQVRFGDAQKLLSFAAAEAKLLGAVAVLPPKAARKIWREVVALAIAEAAVEPSREETASDQARWCP